jgi:hypothetical protein
MVTPALAAATLWLVYNWVTFADPLAFLAGLRSPTPAGEGLAPSAAPLAGDVAGALTAVGVAAHSVVGWPLLIVAALGLLFALASFRRIDVVLFMITASAPMLFTVVAMYAGGVVVWNSAVTSTAIWHNRVGVAVIIPVAVFTAIMIEATVRDPRWHGWVRVVTAALTAIALASPAVSTVADPARSLVLAEARDSYARSTDSYQAAEWLAARYDGGGIGLDESVWTNAVLPSIGIPLREYRLRSDGVLFTRMLEDPSAQVRWVWISNHPADALTVLPSRSRFTAGFSPVFTNHTITIYRWGGAS